MDSANPNNSNCATSIIKLIWWSKLVFRLLLSKIKLISKWILINYFAQSKTSNKLLQNDEYYISTTKLYETYFVKYNFIN